MEEYKDFSIEMFKQALNEYYINKKPKTMNETEYPVMGIVEKLEAMEKQEPYLMVSPDDKMLWNSHKRVDTPYITMESDPNPLINRANHMGVQEVSWSNTKTIGIDSNSATGVFNEPPSAPVPPQPSAPKFYFLESEQLYYRYDKKTDHWVISTRTNEEGYVGRFNAETNNLQESIKRFKNEVL